MKRQSKDRMIKRIKQLKNQYENKEICKQDLSLSLAGFYGNIKRMTVNGIVKKYLSELKRLVKKQ